MNCKTAIRFKIAGAITTVLTALTLSAQTLPSLPSFGICKPVTQRTQEVGCWVTVDRPIGTIDRPQIFWHLDVYPSRAEAEKAKNCRGIVLEAFEKVWLLSIEKSGWRPALKGTRVAEIGPLPVTSGESYSVLILEDVSNPGTMSSLHTHSGPEAWYILSGEACLETPSGAQTYSAGRTPIIVPSGSPMRLTTTGTAQRRGLTLILHETKQFPTAIVHDWAPKGLCKLPPPQTSQHQCLSAVAAGRILPPSPSGRR